MFVCVQIPGEQYLQDGLKVETGPIPQRKLSTGCPGDQSTTIGNPLQGQYKLHIANYSLTAQAWVASDVKQLVLHKYKTNSFTDWSTMQSSITTSSILKVLTEVQNMGDLTLFVDALTNFVVTVSMVLSSVPAGRLICRKRILFTSTHLEMGVIQNTCPK